MRDSLKNEVTYDQERLDQHLWRLSRELRVSRRQLMRMGAGATALAGSAALCSRKALADHTGSVVKPTPPELFYILGTNREMRWEAMKGQGYLTPIDRFFVRNHNTTPHIDMATWRLRIFGSGVTTPVELTYDDILAMPSTTETKFIECAGNGRKFFQIVGGTPATGTQWLLGAIGVAEWTGVRLSTVLERAGVKPTAVDVMGAGLDVQQVRRPMSIEKALEDDTLLVYGMNGQPLPEDHGFPVRLLTPGWVGISNIKWVGGIEVSETPLFSTWNTTLYILIGDAYPNRPPVYDQVVKSALELPYPATLPAGTHILTGRSWSGVASIASVAVSTDGGASWRSALLETRNIPKAWVQWSIDWQAAPGSYTLLVRATDHKGNVQPDTVTFNQQGYLYGGVAPHPVTVV